MPDKKTARTVHQQSDELVERIRPILAGNTPDVVGATLGDLLAIFLASYQGAKPAALAALRDELLTSHIVYVRDLVALYDRMIAADVDIREAMLKPKPPAAPHRH